MESTKNKPIKEKREMIAIRKLGKGSFSEVFLGKYDNSDKFYAIKVVRKEILENDEILRHFKYELSILAQLEHENVSMLHEIRKTQKSYLLILDYCNGGDLKSCLNEYKKLHNGKPFSEKIVQYILKQILNGLNYLHNSKKIIHRDLKLENILVKFKNEKDKKILNLLESKVEICDFGSAKLLDSSTLTSTVIGTPFNMAPQILDKKNTYDHLISPSEIGKKNYNLTYDFKADIYSLGTLCYEMLFGVRPFDANNGKELYDKIEMGYYNFPKNLVDLNISQEAVDILLKMLCFEPNKRCNAEELLNDPFITKNYRDFKVYRKEKDEDEEYEKEKEDEEVKKINSNLNINLNIDEITNTNKNEDKEKSSINSVELTEKKDIISDNSKEKSSINSVEVTEKKEIISDNSKKNNNNNIDLSNLKVFDYLNYIDDCIIKKWIREENLIFSIFIQKINRYGYKQKRSFVITDKAIYHFDNKILKSFLLIKDINGITLSITVPNPQLIIHCLNNKHDYFYFSPGKKETLEIIESLGKIYKALFDKDLKIFIINNKNLKEYVTTEKERLADPNITKIPKENDNAYTYKEILKLKD